MSRFTVFIHAGVYLALTLLLVACGGEGGKFITPLTTSALSLVPFVGNIEGPGTVDGTGTAARVSSPVGMATDSSGNVYVADTGNHTIRKITPAGVVTTLAGAAGVWGSTDGTGTAARFNSPLGVATDSSGNVYVADAGNHSIRKVSPAGVVTTLAGSASVEGSVDGNGAAARFKSPMGVATDSSGNVYVADTGNHIIRKVTPAGVVATLAGSAGVVGSANGTGAAAGFNTPWGVATDSSGNVYVADTGNHTIRKITTAGVVTTLAGTAGTWGSANGSGAAASFNVPRAVATDSSGNVYVADAGNSTIRLVNPAGAVTTLAGSAGVVGSDDGTGAAARFNGPSGVATDSSGNVYVADTYNHTVRKITSAGVVTTLAGPAGASGAANGSGAAARFNGPNGVATNSAGTVYVADTGNNTIRKVTPAGAVSTLAGSAGVAGIADGSGAAARFNGPRGVATDSAGNVYVADIGNNTIRKITSVGVVTTLAGTAGMSGSANGSGAAARFNGPSAVATDSVGNVYVADTGNNTVRKITPAGVVTTLAGSAGAPPGSANGSGATARFSYPRGVATDSAGNVYVADTGNNTVRKITPAGEVTTLAGTANMTGSADGSGAAARFSSPLGIVTDSVGYVYVADTGNHTIRMISPAGVVMTVVGVAGRSGFTAGALPGVLSSPTGIVFSGRLIYITSLNGVVVVR